MEVELTIVGRNWLQEHQPRARARSGLADIGIVILLTAVILIGLFVVYLINSYKPSEYIWEDVIIHKKELKEDISLNRVKLKFFEDVKDWSLTDLGDNLEVNVEIASTKDILLKIESRKGIEINDRGRIFNHNLTIEGPSLVIELKKPSDVYNPLWYAELSGEIKIYHKFDVTEKRRVPIEPTGD